ncbi:MAG: UDP-N-acetylmuramoyl-tripeptide--D-alanyl-D-alanine ligase [Patescibacteria group bacterium]
MIIFKKIIAQFLRILAKKTLRAYRPKIVGITGSVGKTSTAYAITLCLASKYRVRGPEKNYNNELGLPLAILGEKTQGKNIFGWINVLLRGLFLSLGLRHDYPEILILEYGADKKGDIAYLTSIARPFVSVITSVGHAHAEYFGTVEDVFEEKSMLVRATPEDGCVILNADDLRVMEMKKISLAPSVTFGLSPSADFHADEVRQEYVGGDEAASDNTKIEMNGTIKSDSDSAPFKLKNILGEAHLRAICASVAVAAQFGIGLKEAAEALSAYSPMPGRMKILAGIKRSVLLDDTYNASPEAVHAALEVLAAMPVNGAKRIAVLGDMLELGRYALKSHQDVGAHIASLPISLLVTVGEQARDIAKGAIAAGMNQNSIFPYAKAEDAGRFVQEKIEKGDVVLLKGSQGIRLEKAVKELMAEPLRSKELLVRQDELWN